MSESIEWEPGCEEVEDDPVCPCGHRISEHYAGDSHCEVRGCDCPEFGKPTEEYEVYTITTVGDGPGGFTVCE